MPKPAVESISSVVVAAAFEELERLMVPVLVSAPVVAIDAPSLSDREPATSASPDSALLLAVAPSSATNALVPSIDSDPLAAIWVSWPPPVNSRSVFWPRST